MRGDRAKAASSGKVIDLTGDFGLSTQMFFARHYGQSTPRWTRNAILVYGLTETNRDVIRSATRIANRAALRRRRCWVSRHGATIV